MLFKSVFWGLTGCWKPGPVVFVRYFYWRVPFCAVLLCYFFEVKVCCRGLRDLVMTVSGA
jgi:hypothetical protein